MGKPIIWSGSNAKLINSGDLVDKNDFSLSDGPKISYPWPSHGLTSADIGRPVRIVSANQLAFAQADTAANAEVAGFIYGIIDSSNVRLSLWGNCPAIGANAIAGGATSASTVYFLDDANAGKLTAVEPTNVGSISKPIAIGTSLSSFTFLNYRGNTVGSTNARTQISLSNNSTTNMQNCASYDAGSIEGWIYIDGTTDYRFYFNAPFSKYGAGGNYYISPSYVGDTPPAGFSITINSSGQSIVTLPSITGFVSATCTYSLNAPAVGTNFPLALDSANLTNSGITGLTGTAATTAYTSGSGKVGETIDAGNYSNTTATTTESDVQNATATGPYQLTLTPGLWLMQYSVSAYYQTAVTAGSNGNLRVFVTDSSNNHIGKSERIVTSGYANGTQAIISECSLGCSFVLNVTTSTTYKLRLKKVETGTGTGAVERSSGNIDGNFYAVRIA